MFEFITCHFEVLLLEEQAKELSNTSFTTVELPLIECYQILPYALLTLLLNGAFVLNSAFIICTWWRMTVYVPTTQTVD